MTDLDTSCPRSLDADDLRYLAARLRVQAAQGDANAAAVAAALESVVKHRAQLQARRAPRSNALRGAIRARLSNCWNAMGSAIQRSQIRATVA